MSSPRRRSRSRVQEIYYEEIPETRPRRLPRLASRSPSRPRRSRSHHYVRELSYDDIQDVRARELARMVSPSCSPNRKTATSRALITTSKKNLDHDYGNEELEGQEGDDEEEEEEEKTGESKYEVDRTITRRYRGPRLSERERDNRHHARPDLQVYDHNHHSLAPPGKHHDRSSRTHRSSLSHSPTRSRHRDRPQPRPRHHSPPTQPDDPHPDPYSKNDPSGYLFYSMRPRSTATFCEKHFDSSYDGLIAAVAGAAIGSITAARFAGEEHRTWKAVGGAVVGAAAFNTVENHYRVYTEVREEVVDKGKRIAKGVEKGVEGVVDGAGEGVKGVAKAAGRLVEGRH